MRTVLISQRVELIKSYGERRDCLDQNWCGFLQRCGFLPIPVMNREEELEALLDLTKPAGILLSGGNDLAAYGGDAPERDATERRLIALGISQNIPIMGVCRGFQMLCDYFGEKLERVQNHVARRHIVHGNIAREVNSYHNMAVLCAPPGFQVLARAEDGVIEAIQSEEHRITAIMWHPERETPYAKEDIDLFTQFYH